LKGLWLRRKFEKEKKSRIKILRKKKANKKEEKKIKSTKEERCRGT